MSEISLSQIQLGQNARTHIDKKKLEQLTGSIAALGLIEPIVVEESKDGTLTLIAGFRRFAALKELKIKALPRDKVTIRKPGETAKTNAAVVNIAENIREDLPPHDLAVALHRMVRGVRDEEGNEVISPTHTREEGAKVLGMSVGFLNNLVRCAEKLSPTVLAAWKKDPENITTRQIVAWTTLPHEEQEKALAEHLGGAAHDKKRAKGKEKVKAGRTKPEILAMIEKLEGQSGARIGHQREALEWVVGTRKSLK